jgi:penicillin-binding protein 2
LRSFFSFIREKFYASREKTIISTFVLLSIILVARLFVLQILKGNSYRSNFNLLTEKKETRDASRGNIYDRNGNLLAYNEIANNITIEDMYSGLSRDDRNKKLNKELYTVITNAERLGDSAYGGDFYIKLNSDGTYEYTVKNTALQRFRADVFDKASITELSYDKKLKLDLANISAADLMKYLYSSKKFGISSKYPEDMRFKIARIRYGMSLNSYQQYISTTIASNVSDSTVAYVKENKSDLPGVSVEQKTRRNYVDAKYFSNIIGYTGKISSEEYANESKNDSTVDNNDIVGKAGIEKVMNSYLKGEKGSDTLYVDSSGKIIKKTDHKNAKTGDDIYLSIDKDLQENTYNLLEKELAGILVSHLTNSKTVDYDADVLMVSVYDAYVNIIKNRLVDYKHFTESDATDLEKEVENEYEVYRDKVINEFDSDFKSSNPPLFKDENNEKQSYITAIIKILKDNSVLDKSKIDQSDSVYKSWAAGTISFDDYLRHCIEMDWINISNMSSTGKYADSNELYNELCSYIIDKMKTDSTFIKCVYEYAIRNDAIPSNKVCALLYDQGILDKDDDSRNALLSGSVSPYNFLLDKIKNIKLSPGQLGLTPCSASCAIIDSKTSEVLALVSYPGYDSNKLANEIDSDYYAYLTSVNSTPLYNHATQQRTAPGSTFKLVTSTAGLTENVITPATTFVCTGEFDLVTNKPKCWIYPGSHGSENLQSAIRDSCNVYFYNVGYNLANKGGSYDDSYGISRLKKYADMYGLTSKTGVEIDENSSNFATQYPVMAAIGQSDNNMTTIGLARYANALATSGNVYNLTILNKVQNKKGEVLKTYAPALKNQVSVLSSSQWNVIHQGMEEVVKTHHSFDDSTVSIAGKTGTAQESKKKPSHSLFIGYAPANDPAISFAIRIPNGYGSANACDVARDIIGCYFKDPISLERSAQAQALENSNSSSGD